MRDHRSTVAGVNVTDAAAPDRYRELDAALARLATASGELRNGLTNHAPMVAEAFCALGRGADAASWLDRYAAHLMPLPNAQRTLAAGDWRATLGDSAREGDWRRHFEVEIAAHGVQTTICTWIPRLTAGLATAALHGVIRTGHGARSLGVADTPLRRAELAAALAYWATHHRTLPGGEGTNAGLEPLAALARVPLLPIALRRPDGSIDAALVPLADWPPFLPVADLISVDDEARVRRALALAFARVYLANARDWITTIVFVHALTGVAALDHLCPSLPHDDACRAVKRLWQAGAALYAAYGTAPPADGPPAAEQSPDTLVDAAIATGDEHAIKITEACLHFHARDPRREFLAVAAHAIRILGA